MSNFIPVWMALGACIAQGEKERNEEKRKAEADRAEPQQVQERDEPDA
jgi:hypothetical protein